MIKKILFPLAIVGISMMVAGCSGGAGIKTKADPKILENKEEVQKIHASLLKKMGDQATKVHEITIRIDNPADKGGTGDSYLLIIVDMQDSGNPKQLVRNIFHGEIGGWQLTQEVTVDVRGSDEEKASFRLENELFDFKNRINGEKLYGIILDAYEKENNDPEKYTYRYVTMVRINIEGCSIYVKGKLAANDQIIEKGYYYDLDGNSVKN